MRILVTGGAGFVGANLVRALVDHPAVDAVRVIDDLSSGAPANLDGLDVDFREGSVADIDLLHAAVEGCDAVAHLAARPSVPRSVKDPVATHTANATGTLRVLEAARAAGGLHVVWSSSSSVYGANPTLPKHEGLVPEPVSPYAASKLAGEAYASAYAASYELPVTTFRFFNVFGPLQPAGHAYAAVVPAFVDAALAGRPLPVFGDGRQSRDFTYIGSVSRVLVTALVEGITSPAPVNLAFGTRTTLLQVAAQLEDIFGRPLERDHQPERPGDVRHSQADQTRFRALFPSVEPVPLEQGLRETVGWFRSPTPRLKP